jgi:dihydrofolate reductase
MAKLIYAAITSLDLYHEDADGSFEWAAPDAEVHAFVNDLERPLGTHLYGRRMYDVLKVWQDMQDDAPVMKDFAEIWRAADKVVYSRTLEEPSTPRTRIEREFDPDAVRALKQSTDRDISIGGPELAAEALRAGLVDEIHLLLHPVIIGNGARALPDGMRKGLELRSERCFASGVVHLHYDVPG